MAISLYDATAARMLITLGAIKNVLAKGRAYAEENGKDVDALVNARICQDMLPLWFQVNSIYHHSAASIESAASGEVGPPSSQPAPDYASLEALIDKAISSLENAKPEDVNALEDKDVTFKMGQIVLPFTAPDFLFSFSLPNFYFHVTTAYDILRGEGVPLGKVDFMGRMPIKQG